MHLTTSPFRSQTANTSKEIGSGYSTAADRFLNQLLAAVRRPSAPIGSAEATKWLLTDIILIRRLTHSQALRASTSGTFGQLSFRGDRSRAASFGARCGGAGMAGIGRIRNSSSIQTTVIRKLFLRAWRRVPNFYSTSVRIIAILENVQPCRNAGDAGSNHCLDAPRLDCVQQI
jgi:hypothetical protein